MAGAADVTDVSERSLALNQIHALIKKHHITLEELAAEDKNSPINNLNKANNINKIKQFLSYLGVLLVLCGFGIMIPLEWQSMGVGLRLISTLGVGFTTLFMFIFSLYARPNSKLNTPLYIMAALFLTMGFFAAIYQWRVFVPNDYKINVVVYGIMFIQQLLLFSVLRKKAPAVIVFFIFFFAEMTVLNFLSQMGINKDYIFLLMGFSLLCISVVLKNTRYEILSPLGNIMGSGFLLWSLFVVLDDKKVSYFYFLVSAAMLYYSVLIKSRGILILGILSFVLFMGYYTEKYFINSLGWPVVLIIIGILLIASSYIFVKINKRFEL